VGLAILAADVDELPQEQRAVLEALRDQGGPYLQNAVLHGKLKALAAVDELTGVLNRRFGLRRLEEEFSRSMRHGLPLSVMMLDVDHFKRFNDDFGHDAGDEVLRRVAQAMEGSARSADVVCRYGGEEFLLVAAGTGSRDAGAVAHRLRRLVETTVVPFDGKQLSVTISAGIASWPIVTASTPRELITAADEALYEAKRRGRNCVCTAGRADVELTEDSGEVPTRPRTTLTIERSLA